jgi:hypothetical protein
MDIEIAVADLSDETKDLLIRFQLSHLHYMMRDEFYDIPGEADWLAEFHVVRDALKTCPETQIAEAAKRLATVDMVCGELDGECENRERRS